MLLRRVLTGKYNRFVLKFQGVSVNQSNESFRHYYIHYGDCVKRFSKNSLESFQRYTKKRFKSKFCMKLHLYRW